MVLKGRQQGCTTYVQGRYYSDTSQNSGRHAFILSHARDTTNHIFAITHRFHAHCVPELKQATTLASSKELKFGSIDSSYSVGTAGTKETARGLTAQLLHGSEVAFWPNAESHLTGLLQSIPSGEDAKGTEIILESTANGVGNMFHKMWAEAEEGIGEYQAIFIPWYWQAEYQEDPPHSFEPTEEDSLVAEIYNLSPAQVYWMHLKRRELRAGWKFKQEYPFTAAEAFQYGDVEGLIHQDLVIAARSEKPELDVRNQARVGGCDPARGGRNKTGFAFRQGRRIWEIATYDDKDTMVTVNRCAKYIEDYKLDMMFIDVVGIGSGVYDRLRQLGYGNKIMAVYASSAAIRPEIYYNKRAEMWGDMREWFENAPVEIPNEDALHRDLTAPLEKEGAEQKLQLVSKKSMKTLGIPSPDLGDACALTFASPVRPRGVGGLGRNIKVLTEYNVLGY